MSLNDKITSGLAIFPNPSDILFNKLSSGSAWTYTATKTCYAMVFATDRTSVKATLNGTNIFATPYASVSDVQVNAGSISLFLKAGDVLKITAGSARGIVMGLR